MNRRWSGLMTRLVVVVVWLKREGTGTGAGTHSRKSFAHFIASGERLVLHSVWFGKDRAPVVRLPLLLRCPYFVGTVKQMDGRCKVVSVILISTESSSLAASFCHTVHSFFRMTARMRLIFGRGWNKKNSQSNRHLPHFCFSTPSIRFSSKC